jgi:hypothetical protein
MPRFYFDVREGAKFTHDDEGTEFEAACMAAEIGRDQLPRGDAREITIELKNEHHQRVAPVQVSLEVHRVEPAPRPRA